MARYEIKNKWLRNFFAEEDFWPQEFGKLVGTVEAELEAGEKGKSESSVSMSDIYMAVAEPGGEEMRQEMCVLDIGGTHLRGYWLRPDESAGGHAVEILTYGDMPGTHGLEVTGEEFLQAICAAILPAVCDIEERTGKVVVIKVSYSYPAHVDTGHEVYPLRLAKEVKVRDFEGMAFRSMLTEMLRETGGLRFDPDVTILNDTVAVYMAGIAEACTKSSVKKGDGSPVAFDYGMRRKMMGVVYGTGFNICYSGTRGAVSLGEGERERAEVLFNTEIGGYARWGWTSVDRALDQRSEHPGAGLGEKRISGSYFGRVYFEVLLAILGKLEAGEVFAEAKGVGNFLRRIFHKDGLLENFSENFPNNAALGDFLGGGVFSSAQEDSLSAEEKTFLCEVLRVVVERSAFYAAILTIGVGKRMVAGLEEGETEILIALEGGLVHQFPGLRASYETYLEEGFGLEGISFRLLFPEAAVLRGSVLAKWKARG